MNRWLMIGVASVLCAGALDRLAPQAAGQPPRRNNWHSTYEAGRAAARQNGKPLMVVFRCER